MAVAQEVERVVYLPEGWLFDPRYLQSSKSVLGQDTEPLIAPCSDSVGKVCDRKNCV